MIDRKTNAPDPHQKATIAVQYHTVGAQSMSQAGKQVRFGSMVVMDASILTRRHIPETAVLLATTVAILLLAMGLFAYRQSVS